MTNQSANQTGGTGQPKILYKYLSLDRLDVLKSKTIRFTQPGDLNDPCEFRPFIKASASLQEVKDKAREIINQEVEKALAQFDPSIRDFVRKSLNVAEIEADVPGLYRIVDPGLLPNAADVITENLNQTVGVLCLSELRDSALMWAHYADSHQGFVVGFNSEHSFFSKRRGENDEFGFLRRVEYEPQRPQVVLTNTSSLDWFQTKFDQWAYEKEWRILRVLSEASYRSERTPFPVCLFEFPPDAVMEIIVGMRFPKLRIAEVQALTVTFPSVRLLAAHEHPEEYGLIIKPLV